MHPEFALHHLLHNSAERDPERVAVVESQSEHTYGELERHSDALCAALVEEEVRKGERVGIYTEKPWEAAVAVLRPSRPGHSCGRRCITSGGRGRLSSATAVWAHPPRRGGVTTCWSSRSRGPWAACGGSGPKKLVIHCRRRRSGVLA